WTLAIGDCTTCVAPTTGRHYRLESVDNATTQAEVAAAVLAGSAAPLSPAPWFWSDQGDQKLQIVGRIEGYTSVVVRSDPSKPRRMVALYFGEEGLVAAE